MEKQSDLTISERLRIGVALDKLNNMDYDVSVFSRFKDGERIYYVSLQSTSLRNGPELNSAVSKGQTLLLAFEAAVAKAKIIVKLSKA